MWDSVIAAASALAGTGLAFSLQQRAATRTEHAARIRQQTLDIRAAGLALAGTLTTHRRHQFTRWLHERTGTAEQTQLDADRAQTWLSRSDVTAAMDALRLTTSNDTILTAATEAIDATYALKHPEDQADMDTRSERARNAHGHLLDAIATHTNA